jgi:hypothetical protein
MARPGKGALALTSTAAVVVALTAGGLALAHSQAHSRVETGKHNARTASLAISSDATTAGASNSVTPADLPPGLTQMTAQPDPHSPATNAKFAAYKIAGGTNSDSEPVGGVTMANATELALHPDTEVDITFVPGVTTMPPTPQAPPGFSVTPVTIAGNAGTLLAPQSGPGVERLDWVDADGYHNVMCDRLKTDNGLSGVSTSDLLQTANSLY